MQLSISINRNLQKILMSKEQNLVQLPVSGVLTPNFLKVQKVRQLLTFLISSQPKTKEH